MAIRIVRLGTPRRVEGWLRIGTVRRPPRGVRREDYAARDIYDVWFPNLSPSEALLKQGAPVRDPRSWQIFRRAFLKEMKRPEARRDLELLAAFSQRSDFEIGCYCEQEALCHRSVLRELLEQLGAAIL